MRDRVLTQHRPARQNRAFAHVADPTHGVVHHGLVNDGDDRPIGWIREIVVDSADPQDLARFWAVLLAATPVQWYPGWVTLEPPQHGQRLSFQRNASSGDGSPARSLSCSSPSWSATSPLLTTASWHRVRCLPKSTSLRGLALAANRSSGGSTGILPPTSSVSFVGEGTGLPSGSAPEEKHFPPRHAGRISQHRDPFRAKIDPRSAPSASTSFTQKYISEGAWNCEPRHSLSACRVNYRISRTRS